MNASPSFILDREIVGPRAPLFTLVRDPSSVLKSRFDAHRGGLSFKKYVNKYEDSKAENITRVLDAYCLHASSRLSRPDRKWAGFNGMTKDFGAQAVAYTDMVCWPHYWRDY